MNSTTGFTRIIKAAGYSLKGLQAAWRHEAAFRQESILLFVAGLLAAWLDVSVVERFLVFGSVPLLLILEIINSAIEAVVDRIGSEHHELSGRAKDMGSAAVFIALWLALFAWVSILWSHYWP